MAPGPLESEVSELPSSCEHMLAVPRQIAGFCATVTLPLIGGAIRVTTASEELQLFGHKLQCCFDGSLRGKHGAGGWAVYVEIR
eukprot:10235856-Karenia_brevis.AAC.1